MWRLESAYFEMRPGTTRWPWSSSLNLSECCGSARNSSMKVAETYFWKTGRDTRPAAGTPGFDHRYQGPTSFQGCSQRASPDIAGSRGVGRGDHRGLGDQGLALDHAVEDRHRRVDVDDGGVDVHRDVGADLDLPG